MIINEEYYTLGSDSMKIGICDDILECLDEIKTYVEHYFSNEICEIFTYSNGNNLLNSNIEFDILFLDIELQDTTGIEVAKQVLANNPATIIVIVTNYRKYLDDAMDMNVLRFVDKPATQERINEVLNRAVSELNSGTITVRSKSGKIVKNKKSDIVYIEVWKRTTTFYTVSGVVETTEPITKFKELLDSPQFAIPHNSYIVNLNYVLSYERDKVEVNFGDKPHIISIATRKQTMFRKKFIDFLGET